MAQDEVDERPPVLAPIDALHNFYKFVCGDELLTRPDSEGVQSNRMLDICKGDEGGVSLALRS